MTKYKGGIGMQKKWQSKLLWASIATQVLSLLVLTGVVTPTDSEQFNLVIGGVLQLLVTVGVLNNPNDATKL